MLWFKLYAEARTDAKLRSLTDAQFRVWFNLLCYATEQETPGTIEAEDDTLLALEIAGGDVDLMNATLQRLEALRIVASAARVQRNCSDLQRVGAATRCISVAKWSKRQRKTVALSSTERSRKCREQKKLREACNGAAICSDVAAPRARAVPDEIRGDENQPPSAPPRGGRARNRLSREERERAEREAMLREINKYAAEFDREEGANGEGP